LGAWSGAKSLLLGAGLGLAVLLPFVVIRAWERETGSWWEALGAFVGPGNLLDVLLITFLVAGVMAAA